MRYVYILKGEKFHYIGSTSSISRRLQQHRSGDTKTTRRMGKLVLLGWFKKENEQDARKLEKIIKRDGHIQHRINHISFVKNEKFD